MKYTGTIYLRGRFVMAEKDYQVNKNRILEEFFKLASYDSESFNEAGVSAYLVQRLNELGLTVYQDSAKEKIQKNKPEYANAASNIYAYLKGNVEGEPVLFSSHMDTVSPGKGKKPVLSDDGIITSQGDTVLGADDISGIVSILEALTLIKENNLAHPDIEVLFMVAEEPYCEGSRYLEYDRIHAGIGYVLDLVGNVGTAAIAAPSIISVAVNIKGKASHAGFAPNEGINALNIAVKALSTLKTGYVRDDTTVNFGVIKGGTGRNIVPENVFIEGEIRSLVHEKAMQEADIIKKTFEDAANEFKGVATVNITEHKAYKVEKTSKTVARFIKAAGGVARCTRPECITTFGGSDANRLNEHNIETIVLACAMENCHSTQEYTNINELCRSAELTLRLMTEED
jgi:tripeptide aminopeptidase